MTDFIQIHTTFPTKDAALALAQLLVERRLAACVQVGGNPLTSVYRWKAAVETSDEYSCLIKTRSAWFSQIEQTIRENHSYEVPEIVALPLSQISADYATWLAAELPLSVDPNR